MAVSTSLHPGSLSFVFCRQEQEHTCDVKWECTRKPFALHDADQDGEHIGAVTSAPYGVAETHRHQRRTMLRASLAAYGYSSRGGDERQPGTQASSKPCSPHQPAISVGQMGGGFYGRM